MRWPVEALVFASPQPLTAKEIGRVLGGVPKASWQRALEELRADYARDERGLQLVEVAGGWQITTRPEYHDWVRELLDPKTPITGEHPKIVAENETHDFGVTWTGEENPPMLPIVNEYVAEPFGGAAAQYGLR